MSVNETIRCRSPARVNLIGEHTDYNAGFVLPTTTALYTTAVANPRPERIIEITSASLRQSGRFSLDRIGISDAPQWIDYAKGVAAEIEALGVHLQGAFIEVDSDIPLGGGLSSSAAFELAVANALLEVAGGSLPAPDIAALCRRAENRYAGVSCGIMDQYTVALCQRGHAMLLDCRSLEFRQVTIPAEASFIVTHSGVQHQLTDSNYNDRAAECAEAVSLLSAAGAGITALRDVDSALLDASRQALGERLYRRCRHVVSENRRTTAAFAALESGDLESLGALVAASQISQRDDYEVSCPEVDALVATADSIDGVLGSRMIGGGFGGCVLSLVRRDRLDVAAETLRERLTDATGKAPWMHIMSDASPAGNVRSGET